MRITANMSEKESSLSKQNYSWLLYSWLVNEPSSYHRNFLEKLFESSLNLSWWLNYYDFFIKLFKASYLCKLTDERFSTYYLNTVICRIKQTNYKADYYNLLNSLYNNNLLSKYSALSSWYVLNRYSNYFEFLNKKSNSTFFFKKQYEWNTFFFNLELNKYNYLLKFKQGFFFFNELNFSNLFKFTTNLKELWAINHYVKNQLASSKWNRWLYKYSILHRKVLKNSHKITTAKRLLNSGFYNNKLFDRNVWASETLKKYNTSFNFNGAFNLYYPNNFTDAKITIWNNAKKFIINNSNNYDNLALLSQYENSYFWTLKRFYLFNTMSSNKTSSSLFFKNNANFAFNKKNEINRSATLSYFFFNSNLLKSFVLNNFQFSFGYETPFSANFFVNNFTARSSFLFNLKDTYNVVFENELFNLDDLQFISWISTAPLTSNTSSSFFNYLLILNSASFVESSFRDKKNNSLLEISDYILFSEFELDEFFFTDFYIYSILSNK